jgi:hypothetical protein
MKKSLPALVIAMALAALVPDTAWAIKPGEEFNPNGFLNGAHYNLNIHGKKPNFTCPEQEYDSEGNPIYGNSVFIPVNGSSTRIMMQSGKKGGKADSISSLQAIDPCAKAFDNSDVVIQIPPGEYRVFGRALATPTGEPYLETVPSLERHEDSSGTSYFYMGTLASNGYFTTPTQTFTRRKGKSKAAEISGLFKWTGSVCYLDPADCPDTSNCAPTETALCCVPDAEGGYESCGYGADTCEGVLLAGYCSDYSSAWIFNIAEFVDYLWTADNEGLKLLQVRFYPVN